MIACMAPTDRDTVLEIVSFALVDLRLRDRLLTTQRRTVRARRDRDPSREDGRRQLSGPNLEHPRLLDAVIEAATRLGRQSNTCHQPQTGSRGDWQGDA
jgi:hypothetical protein